MADAPSALRGKIGATSTTDEEIEAQLAKLKAWSDTRPILVFTLAIYCYKNMVTISDQYERAHNIIYCTVIFV